MNAAEKQVGVAVDQYDLIGNASPLHRWLLAAMAAIPSDRQSQMLSSVPAASLSSLLDLADRNQIGPIAAHQVAALWPGSPEGERARVMHDKSARRMEILLGELDEVAGRLLDKDVPLVALKNGGIARGIHPCAACCPMGDIDVLVEKADYEEAHAVLLDCGFTLASRGSVERADLLDGLLSGGTEYVKSAGGEEVWFELQWRPVAGRWIRPEQEPKAPESPRSFRWHRGHGRPHSRPYRQHASGVSAYCQAFLRSSTRTPPSHRCRPLGDMDIAGLVGGGGSR